MPSINDFSSRGKVLAVQADRITFAPLGTDYEFFLVPSTAAYNGPTGVPVDGFIRVVARKLWTVPSGGGFVSPIFGPPKTIQGRVKFIGDREMVVSAAGTNFIVALPKDDSAYDLTSGEVTVGALVNVVGMPGATFELAAAPVASTVG